MKTIKLGDRELLKNYKYFSCKRCGWIGKAEEKEYQSDTQYNTTYYWADCPICYSRAVEIIDEGILKKVKELEKKNDEEEAKYYNEYPIGR